MPVSVPVADAVEVAVVPHEHAVTVEVRAVMVAVTVAMAVVVVVVVMMAVTAMAGLSVARRGDSRQTEGSHGSQGESSALEHDDFLWA